MASGVGVSDGGAKGELIQEETKAFEQDFNEVNRKIKSLSNFVDKEAALNWVHDYIHPVAVNHDVEIGVNIFDNGVGKFRIGNAVTDYFRHEISATTLLTSSPGRGWSRGWVANWHSHADGISRGFSSSDMNLYGKWRVDFPKVTYHMSRINPNSKNVLDNY